MARTKRRTRSVPPELDTAPEVLRGWYFDLYALIEEAVPWFLHGHDVVQALNHPITAESRSRLRQWRRKYQDQVRPALPTSAAKQLDKLIVRFCGELRSYDAALKDYAHQENQMPKYSYLRIGVVGRVSAAAAALAGELPTVLYIANAATLRTPRSEAETPSTQQILGKVYSHDHPKGKGVCEADYLRLARNRRSWNLYVDGIGQTIKKTDGVQFYRRFPDRPKNRPLTGTLQPGPFDLLCCYIAKPDTRRRYYAPFEVQKNPHSSQASSRALGRLRKCVDDKMSEYRLFVPRARQSPEYKLRFASGLKYCILIPS